jgi:hypothetical protein
MGTVATVRDGRRLIPAVAWFLPCKDFFEIRAGTIANLERVFLVCPNSERESSLTPNSGARWCANKMPPFRHRPLRHAPCILCGIARARPRGRPARVWFADWLGRRPTRSESACLSRTLARLEAGGLVRRVASRRVRLTVAGQHQAEPYLEQLWMP